LRMSAGSPITVTCVVHSGVSRDGVLLASVRPEFVSPRFRNNRFVLYDIAVA
jgi:hypothetical protein